MPDLLKDAPIETVFFYPFTIDADCNSEPCDPSAVTPDGWCVYARHENVGDDFDVSRENNFDTREEAMNFAEKLAWLHGVEFEEYTG